MIGLTSASQARKDRVAHPDPHAFIQHLQDRLAAVAADALKISHAHRYDLPARFGEMIALAAAELRDWEQGARAEQLEREHQAAYEANSKRGRGRPRPPQTPAEP